MCIAGTGTALKLSRQPAAYDFRCPPLQMLCPLHPERYAHLSNQNAVAAQDCLHRSQTHTQSVSLKFPRRQKNVSTHGLSPPMQSTCLLCPVLTRREIAPMILLRSSWPKGDANSHLEACLLRPMPLQHMPLIYHIVVPILYIFTCTLRALCPLSNLSRPSAHPVEHFIHRLQ